VILSPQIEENMINGRMFINGNWRDGKQYIEVVNPFSNDGR